MDRKLLKDCPVCGGRLQVKVLECNSCQTKIEGNFEPPVSRISNLSGKDLQFVELFVKSRGSIKEMEKELGVSYPTVRSMLDRVIKNMGYSLSKEEEKSQKKNIIDRLEKGEISAEEAARLLKSEE